MFYKLRALTFSFEQFMAFGCASCGCEVWTEGSKCDTCETLDCVGSIDVEYDHHFQCPICRRSSPAPNELCSRCETSLNAPTPPKPNKPEPMSQKFELRSKKQAKGDSQTAVKPIVQMHKKKRSKKHRHNHKLVKMKKSKKKKKKRKRDVVDLTSDLDDEGFCIQCEEVLPPDSASKVCEPCTIFDKKFRKKPEDPKRRAAKYRRWRSPWMPRAPNGSKQGDEIGYWDEIDNRIVFTHPEFVYMFKP